MRNQVDFTRAFGPADAAFEQTVHRTLDALQAQEKEKYMKKKLRITTAVALAAALILTTVAFAAANRLGLIDMLTSYRQDAVVLPEASDLVVSDIAQTGGDTGDAQFTVREAIYDGTNVYLAVAVTAKDENVLLLGPDCMPSDPIANLTGEPAPESAESIETVADYADRNGLTLRHTSINAKSAAAGDEGIVNSISFRLESDNTLVYTISGHVDDAPAELPLTLSCVTVPFVKAEADPSASASDAEPAGTGSPDQIETTPRTHFIDDKSIQRADLSFTLTAAEPIAVVGSSEAVDFADCGVRVTGVRLTSTAMSVYTEISYEVTDAEKYAALDDGLFFEFVDENGNALPGGLGDGSCAPLDESMTAFVLRWSFAATETLPETVTLRAYNCWTGERLSTVDISLN